MGAVGLKSIKNKKVTALLTNESILAEIYHIAGVIYFIVQIVYGIDKILFK